MAQDEEKQEKQEIPWVHLDVVVITLRGLEAVRTQEEAEALAAAAGAKMDRYTEKGNGSGDGGETTVVLYEPFTALCGTRTGGPESGETEIMVQIHDMEGFLLEELEWAAGLLEQAILLARQRDPQDTGPRESAVMKTRHCMNTDRIPDGQPENRMDAPISEMFLTHSRYRCVNAITWERDEDAEKDILEETGETGKEYRYWSESITTLPSTPRRRELREVLMATYTVGARFLLKDILEERNPGG